MYKFVISGGACCQPILMTTCAITLTIPGVSFAGLPVRIFCSIFRRISQSHVEKTSVRVWEIATPQNETYDGEVVFLSVVQSDGESIVSAEDLGFMFAVQADQADVLVAGKRRRASSMDLHR